MNETREKINGFSREKLESSLAKNPNLLSVMEKSDLEFRVRTKFAPLVLVDVERLSPFAEIYLLQTDLMLHFRTLKWCAFHLTMGFYSESITWIILILNMKMAL